MSVSLLRSTLIENGYSFKKITRYPKKRNATTTKELRVTVRQHLIYSIYSGLEIIFVDETSFHLNTKRRYVWGKKGKKLSLASSPKTSNYSIIAAITDATVLGCQVAKGEVKKKDFLAFICNLIRYYSLHEESIKIVIFAENASVHHARIVKGQFQGKLTFLYNAAYTSMLNPIEEFFSKFKILLRKMPTSTRLELLRSAQRALTLFSTDDLHGYIRHTLAYAEDALSKKDMI